MSVMWVMQQDFVQRFHIFLGTYLYVCVPNLGAYLDHLIPRDPQRPSDLRRHFAPPQV
jgi:hypothetical protein